MEFPRAAETLFSVSLNPTQIEQFDLYMQELIDWNENRMNLTAIREPAAINIRHFLDSLSILKDVSVDDGDRLIDVGTGAGFPGLPLAIAKSELQVTLLDATGKKIRFLQHVIDLLKLQNVVTLQMRAEDAGRKSGEHRGRYDIVVARAVARLPALLEYLLPLAKMGGYCIAMKGETAVTESHDARKALHVLGGELIAINEIQLPDVVETHYLVVVEKVRNTPKNYPRNAGTPTRNPIE